MRKARQAHRGHCHMGDTQLATAGQGMSTQKTYKGMTPLQPYKHADNIHRVGWRK